MGSVSRFGRYGLGKGGREGRKNERNGREEWEGTEGTEGTEGKRERWETPSGLKTGSGRVWAAGRVKFGNADGYKWLGAESGAFCHPSLVERVGGVGEIVGEWGTSRARDNVN